MDQSALTPEDVAVLHTYAQRMARRWRGWQFLRYFLLAMALSQLALAWWYWTFASRTAMDLSSAPSWVTTPQEAATWAAQNAYAAAMLTAFKWSMVIFPMWIGLWLLGHTLTHWHRHVESKAVLKAVCALVPGPDTESDTDTDGQHP